MSSNSPNHLEFFTFTLTFVIVNMREIDISISDERQYRKTSMEIIYIFFSFIECILFSEYKRYTFKLPICSN